MMMTSPEVPARQPAHGAGNQEGDLREALYVVAQLAGSDLVLAHSRDGPPEGRCAQHRHEGHHQGKDRGDVPVDVHGVEEVDAGQFRSADAGQAVRAASPFAQFAVGQDVHQLR
ncbi:hypothetical protein G6F57_021669 [Rhizopus arrhizus]|nr:hypothetical protein G6F57_021669 [Rhizopus arrhizus]